MFCMVNSSVGSAIIVCMCVRVDWDNFIFAPVLDSFEVPTDWAC